MVEHAKCGRTSMLLIALPHQAHKKPVQKLPKDSRNDSEAVEKRRKLRESCEHT
jgi:hypothetical protein